MGPVPAASSPGPLASASQHSRILNPTVSGQSVGCFAVTVLPDRHKLTKS
jgi:hypothetical protein